MCVVFSMKSSTYQVKACFISLDFVPVHKYTRSCHDRTEAIFAESATEPASCLLFFLNHKYLSLHLSDKLTDRGARSVKKNIYLICIIVIVSILPIVHPPSLYAQSEEEMKFLLMYFKEEELVVESPTRGRKPLTQVAENISVITAEDIKAMNAHTLSDVLNSVTGVQVFLSGAPGSMATTAVQGSDSRHVSVFIHGVPLNNLLSNVSEIGSISVQNIEKIEIIKGPASSAWGSALGGVVNIITKTGGQQGSRHLVSASFGAKNTGDFRVETSGRNKKLGFYVTAGRLQTDGFTGHNDFSGNNIYAKTAYDITNDTKALVTFGYTDVSRGEGQFLDYGFFVTNRLNTMTSSFGITSNLNQETELSFSVWRMRQRYQSLKHVMDSGAELDDESYRDDGNGSSLKLVWKYGGHDIVAGTDFDSKTTRGDKFQNGEQKLANQVFLSTIQFRSAE